MQASGKMYELYQLNYRTNNKTWAKLLYCYCQKSPKLLACKFKKPEKATKIEKIKTR